MTDTLLTRTMQKLDHRLRQYNANRSKRRGPVTVLEVDGRELRVVQSAPRGAQGAITWCGTGTLERAIALDKVDPKADGASLAQGLQLLRVRPTAAALAIPRGLVFLRTLFLPKTDTYEEMASMVHFQIGKDLPFGTDEAVIDFTVNFRTPDSPAARIPSQETAPTRNAPPPDSAKVEVLVAVVKKEAVDQFVQLAAAAGFKLSALGLSSAANARCLAACLPGAARQTMALVSLRQEAVIVDIIEGHSLAFSRMAIIAGSTEKAATANLPSTEKKSAPAVEQRANGPLPPTEEAGLLNAVAIEVLRTLHNYEGLEKSRKVEKLLIAGGTGQAGKIATTLTKRLSIPCELVDPAGALGLKIDSEVNSPGALTALGLALGAQDQEGLPFDFLHPKQPPAPRNWRRIQLIAAATVLVIALAGLGSLRAHLIHKRLKIKDELQLQVGQAEKNRPLYRDMRLKAKIVHDWALEKREWLDHYVYLSTVLPPSTDIYVTSITTGSRGVIHLSVQARNGEILAQMDKRLREAGYDLKPLAVTPSADKYGYSFQSSLELTLPAKMKMELGKLAAPARPADDGSLLPAERRRRPTTAPTVTAQPASAKPAAAQADAAQPAKAKAIVIEPLAVQPAVVESSRPSSPTNPQGTNALRRMRRNRL